MRRYVMDHAGSVWLHSASGRRRRIMNGDTLRILRGDPLLLVLAWPGC